jgi:hypothetical protein
LKKRKVDLQNKGGTRRKKVKASKVLKRRQRILLKQKELEERGERQKLNKEKAEDDEKER